VTEPTKQIEDVRDFWNSRAGLGLWAGTRDVTLKSLEIEAIAQQVEDGMRILEVGCGNGITAIELARRYDVQIAGIDYAPEMITAARGLADGQHLKGSVQFEAGDVDSVPSPSEKFDLIYTERMLINLPDWETQRQAIVKITKLLADNGLYVMCENSQDGLDKINALRERIGLPRITPPWHNRYLLDAELDQANIPGVELEDIKYFTSTYYFLSRVVNAWLAAREKKQPDYDAPINQLALELPSSGDLGQTRLWLWRQVNHDMASIRPNA